MKKKLLVLFTLSVFVLSGCAGLHKREKKNIFDVVPVPTYMPLNVTEVSDDELGIADYKINDKKVYKFAYVLRDTLAKKVKQGRVGEELFSGLQVTLSAFAAAFSASTGVHVDVVTTLAGLSALTPDIADVISAGDKAKAYSQGLDLVEAALSRYIAGRTPNVTAGEEFITEAELTAEGAQLFITTVSSLKVMRDALLLTIPDAEVLAKATGKYELFAMNTKQIDIQLTAAELNGTGANAAAILAANTAAANANLGKLSDAAKARYQRNAVVVKGQKLKYCKSEAPAIATVNSCAGEQSITINPLAEGTSKIIVISESGDTAEILVKVDAT